MAKTRKLEMERRGRRQTVRGLGLINAFGRFTQAEMMVLTDYARRKGLSFAATLRLVVANQFEKEIERAQRELDELEKKRSRRTRGAG